MNLSRIVDRLRRSVGLRSTYDHAVSPRRAKRPRPADVDLDKVYEEWYDDEHPDFAQMDTLISFPIRTMPGGPVVKRTESGGWLITKDDS